MEAGIEGPWKSFVFKMITASDQPKVLEHMRNFLYFPGLSCLGYEKHMDDEFEEINRDILNDGYNISFFAMEKETNKVAGVRIITVVKRDSDSKPSHEFRNSDLADVLEFHNDLGKQCQIFDKFNVLEYADCFGTSVDPEYRQQGLATEMFRRAIILLQAKGFTLLKCGFSNPYSRKAAVKNGYIELSRKYICEGRKENGDVFNTKAGMNEYVDMGVFKLE